MEELHTKSDEALKTLAEDVQKELIRRDKERKRKAAEEMRWIAAANGLEVSVTEKGKKRRGRPPKRS